MNSLQKLKQKIWYYLYPIFPSVERGLLFLHEKNRQEYHIGWLAADRTLPEMKEYLATKWGFGNHFVAWEDRDQVLSWRKLTSFKEQYHLRIYSDGEIRGHFELTPEAAPVKHFLSKGEQAKTEDFLRFLGPFVSIEKHVSVIEPDLTVTSDSEITYK